MKQTNQHKLKITEQPEKIFHNQQFGKRHGFQISVYTNFTSDSLKLQAELVYADNFEKPTAMKMPRKKNNGKPMLEILDKQDFEAGHASIYCRINDVSRNHGGKHFSILLKCVDGKKCIAETYTQAIKVISKAPKSKAPKASRVIKVTKTKRKRASPPRATAPKKTRLVESLFHRGFKLLQNITHNNTVGYYDKGNTQPIRQCPMCLGRNSRTVATPKHTSSCPVVALLDEYENTVNSPEGANSTEDADSINSPDRQSEGANSTEEADSINSPDSVMADVSPVEERDDKFLRDIFDFEALQHHWS